MTQSAPKTLSGQLPAVREMKSGESPEKYINGVILPLLRQWMSLEDMAYRRNWGDINNIVNNIIPSITTDVIVDFNIPLLHGIVFSVYSSTGIQWTAGSVYYNGVETAITAGNTANANVYIDVSSGTPTIGSASSVVLANDRWWVATNIGGTVYESYQSPIIHGALIQANTIQADKLAASITYTGTLVVGTRTSLTSGAGMYSDGSGNWSVGDGDNYYIKADASAHTLTIGGAGLIIEGAGDAGVDTYYQSSAPSSPNAGDLWYDTDDYSLYRYSGSVWNEISDVTANNTALNTTNVGSILASSVAGWASISDTTKIDGGNIFTGTVSATAIASTFTWSKNFIMSTDGKIYTSGKTSYVEDVNGIFIGYDTDSTTAYKMYIGNNTKHLKWDGTDIYVNGTKGTLGTAGSVEYKITDNQLIIGNSTAGSEDYWKMYINSSVATMDGIDYQSSGQYGVMRITPGMISIGHESTAAYGTTREGFRVQANSSGYVGMAITAYSSFSSSNYCRMTFDTGGLEYSFYNGSTTTKYLDIDANGTGHIGKTSGAKNITLTSGDVSIPQTCVGMVAGVAYWNGSSVTHTQTVGSGVSISRISTGIYRVNLGTGNWVANFNCAVQSPPIDPDNNELIINQEYDSGYFSNDDADGNISITGGSGYEYDGVFSYIAFKIS